VRRLGEQVEIALMESSLLDRLYLLDADRPRGGLRADAVISVFALLRCEDLPVSYPATVEIGGKDDGRSYEWTSPCGPARLVDASNEAVAAIPEDTLAGEQINSRSDLRADYSWARLPVCCDEADEWNIDRPAIMRWWGRRRGL
jgi:hypothetical protein